MKRIVLPKFSVFTFICIIFLSIAKINSQVVPPILSNFRIDSGEGTRVYFDSNIPIQGSSSRGFIVSGKSVSGLKVNSGQTTGHYLTVSQPFTFWDNNTIRYEGGSDLMSSTSVGLDNFDLQYIKNNIGEPNSGSDRYVTVRGAGSHDGSLGNEWTLEEAFRNARSGMTVWIASGDYGSVNAVIGSSGTPENPIKFIGYKSRVGDSPGYPKTVGINFSSSEMPLLRNGSGIGINTNKKSYIIIRNIQIEGYSEYGIQLDDSKFTVIDNVYIRDVVYGIRTVDFNSSNNRVINTYVADCEATGIRVYNKHNLIANSFVCSTKVVNMDYYISVYGGSEGGSNIILNSTVDRFGGDSHTGHGISLKTGDFTKQLKYNLIQDCKVLGFKKSLEARHFHCDNNVFRNIDIGRGRERDKSKVGGIAIMNGASYNIFENIVAKDMDNAIIVLSSNEDPDAPHAGTGNIIRNCVFTDVSKVVDSKEDNTGQNREFFDNKIINCTLVKSKVLIVPKLRFSANEFINCIISGITYEKPQKIPLEIGFEYTYCNFYNNSKFVTPFGNGNCAYNPLFEDEFNGKFSLSRESKLIDSGTNSKLVKIDCLGTQRPQNHIYDIGAYEYQNVN